MEQIERPWSASIRLDEVPESGRHVVLEASAVVREELARPVGVDAVEQLTATFDLTRRGRDRLHVSGRVAATVRQTCVVTLEPVLNEIAEDIEVDFVPPGEMNSSPEAVDLEEVDLASSGSDEPEPLVGNAVDLGRLATEFLVLAVDRYPRKPDAAFQAPAAGDPSAHPFAALAAWNKKGTVKE